jgi:hypothetical protein
MEHEDVLLAKAFLKTFPGSRIQESYVQSIGLV